MTALALCLLSACASPPRLVAPELEAAGLQLQQAGLLQQQFLLTLRIYNPNAVSLPVDYIQYRFELGGKLLAEGETVLSFSVPSKESREFDVRMRTDLLSGLRSLVRWMDQGHEAVEYRLAGRVGVDLPFVPPFPFSQQGSIPLRLDSSPAGNPGT